MSVAAAASSWLEIRSESETVRWVGCRQLSRRRSPASSTEVAIVRDRVGISEEPALAYCSAAADFGISLAVNGAPGVHCLIERADLEHIGEVAIGD